MAKKDIGKILTTGSLRQRAILYWEDIARAKYFQERLLTDSDKTQLFESFKKPNEARLWNEFRQLDDTVTTAIINLQGLLFEVKMHYSNLRGYILVWISVETAEQLVNSILHEIKDLEERKRIAKKEAWGAGFLFCKTEPDEEGYLNIIIDHQTERTQDMRKKIDPDRTERHTLLSVMNNVRAEAERAVTRYLSWERAILDYMEEKGFNIKTYKGKIKEMTTEVYSPIIGWAKYSGEHTGQPNPQLEKIIKKYAVCPDMGEIKVDEAEYNWFRRYFLDGEDYPEELRGKVNKNISYE